LSKKEQVVVRSRWLAVDSRDATLTGGLVARAGLTRKFELRHSKSGEAAHSCLCRQSLFLLSSFLPQSRMGREESLEARGQISTLIDEARCMYSTTPKQVAREKKKESETAKTTTLQYTAFRRRPSQSPCLHATTHPKQAKNAMLLSSYNPVEKRRMSDARTAPAADLSKQSIR
jgi:hypothetical protein